MSTQVAIDAILNERRRQMEKEGWTQEHDDGHRRGEMAKAAAAYAYTSTVNRDVAERHRKAVWGHTAGFTSWVDWLWPWEPRWFKPKTPRQDLVRSGALIVAEIERLDRISNTGEDQS